MGWNADNPSAAARRERRRAREEAVEQPAAAVEEVLLHARVLVQPLLGQVGRDVSLSA